MMIIEGEIMDNSSAFVDSLADDECLKASRQPIVAYLIALAIKDGKATIISYFLNETDHTHHIMNNRF